MRVENIFLLAVWQFYSIMKCSIQNIFKVISVSKGKNINDYCEKLKK
jgi:hypothetical protein